MWTTLLGGMYFPATISSTLVSSSFESTYLLSQKNLKTTNTIKLKKRQSYLPVIIFEEMVVSEFLMLLPLDDDQETEHG